MDFLGMMPRIAEKLELVISRGITELSASNDHDYSS